MPFGCCELMKCKEGFIAQCFSDPVLASEWRCDRHVRKISEHDVLPLGSVS